MLRALIVGLLAISSGTAVAQTAFPTKPITWVVGFPAGGGADNVTRLIAAKLAQNIGQSVLVENRPGASGILSAQHVKQAAADGHTLLSVEQGVMIYNAEMYSKIPYDAAKDFVPITNLIAAPLILAVHPSFPANDYAAFVAHVKAQAGKLNFASPGRGLTHHLAMEALKARVGLDIVDVQYKGIAPVVQDVVAGQVPMAVVDTVVGLPNFRAGKLRALAVFADKRLASLPDVPTLAELGVTGFDMAPIVGVVAPRGTPADVVAKLNTELVRALRDVEVSKRLGGLGLELIGDQPTEFNAFLRRESDRWVPLLRKLNIKLD